MGKGCLKYFSPGWDLNVLETEIHPTRYHFQGFGPPVPQGISLSTDLIWLACAWFLGDVSCSCQLVALGFKKNVPMHIKFSSSKCWVVPCYGQMLDEDMMKVRLRAKLAALSWKAGKGHSQLPE